MSGECKEAVGAQDIIFYNTDDGEEEDENNNKDDGLEDPDDEDEVELTLQRREMDALEHLM